MFSLRGGEDLGYKLTRRLNQAGWQRAIDSDTLSQYFITRGTGQALRKIPESISKTFSSDAELNAARMNEGWYKLKDGETGDDVFHNTYLDINQSSLPDELKGTIYDPDVRAPEQKVMRSNPQNKPIDSTEPTTTLEKVNALPLEHGLQWLQNARAGRDRDKDDLDRLRASMEGGHKRR